MCQPDCCMTHQICQSIRVHMVNYSRFFGVLLLYLIGQNAPAHRTVRLDETRKRKKHVQIDIQQTRFLLFVVLLPFFPFFFPLQKRSSTTMAPSTTLNSNSIQMCGAGVAATRLTISLYIHHYSRNSEWPRWKKKKKKQNTQQMTKMAIVPIRHSIADGNDWNRSVSIVRFATNRRESGRRDSFPRRSAWTFIFTWKWILLLLVSMW